MAEMHQIPQDDLLDVVEMTNRIQDYIFAVLEDNDFTLAMSALMGATINSMFAQCNTIEEVVFYRNLFMKIFDNLIKSVQARESGEQTPPPAPPAPPSSPSSFSS